MCLGTPMLGGARYGGFKASTQEAEAGRALVEAELLDCYIDCLQKIKIKKKKVGRRAIIYLGNVLDPIRKGRTSLASATVLLMLAFRRSG